MVSRIERGGARVVDGAEDWEAERLPRMRVRGREVVSSGAGAGARGWSLPMV